MSDTPTATELYFVILPGLPVDLRDRYPVAGSLATGLALHLEFHPDETDRIAAVVLSTLPYSVDDGAPARDLARDLAARVIAYLAARS